METIGVQDLWSFEDEGDRAVVANCRSVRRSRGHDVADYLELAGKIAELQFRNRDYVLMYRGQARDYQNQNQESTLQPTIFRDGRNHQWRDELQERFWSLENAEHDLIERFREMNVIGADELVRHRILRWSILQHYEVHPTPLLDVTQSLRIAASFASIGNESDEAFLFVLGIPNISGAISASAEAGLQVIRLSSVCPPSAIRPHIQEGFLVGEYPEIGTYDQKQLYGLPEIDLGKRLVAKFRFNPYTFWTKSGQFQMIRPRALRPSPAQDPLSDLAQKLLRNISRGSD